MPQPPWLFRRKGIPPAPPRRRELRRFATTFFMLRMKKSSLTCSAAPRFKIVTALLGHDFVFAAGTGRDVHEKSPSGWMGFFRVIKSPRQRHVTFHSSRLLLTFQNPAHRVLGEVKSEKGISKIPHTCVCGILAERVGFEPTVPLPVHLISSQGRYNHFDTAPYVCCSLSIIAGTGSKIKEIFRRFTCV